MATTYPRVEGAWVVDPEQRAELGRNFGRQHGDAPSVVLQPACSGDVATALSWASSVGLPIAARGQAHTTHTQTAAPAGLLIDMRSMRSVGSCTDSSVWAQAGACWSDVLEHTLGRGMTPPTLTDYQRLSVGGTLSVGGIGGESYRTGAQVESVLSLDVATVSDGLVRCSPQHESALFYACLGGLGQFGIITSAELGLVRAPASVETTFIRLDTLAQLLDRLEQLMSDPTYHHLYCNIEQQSFGWRYELVASRYGFESASPSERRIDDAKRCRVWGFGDFCSRVEAFVESMQHGGQWQLAHPWFDVFLPWQAALDAVGAELEQLQDGSLGGGSILLYAVRGAASGRLTLSNSGYHLLFDVLRSAAQDDPARLAKNRAAFERCRRVGGTLYPIGSTPMQPEDWRQHWGGRHAGLARLKRSLDPRGLLGLGHRVFDE